jgi:hypothetical protein
MVGNSNELEVAGRRHWKVRGPVSPAQTQDLNRYVDVVDTQWHKIALYRYVSALQGLTLYSCKLEVLGTPSQ